MAESDTGKLRQPLSYIDWIRTVNLGHITESDMFGSYTQYVREFYAALNTQKATDSVLIKNIYRELLKDITINYTTADEKRFLSNINYDDKAELDIIIPYFVKKLKQITQYLVSKRQDVQFSKIKSSFKGSRLGVVKIISDKIVGLFDDKDFRNKYSTSNLPAASAVSKNLVVDTTTLYDTYQNYYDVDPSIDKSVYTQSVSSLKHYQQFGSNTQSRSSKAFLDLKGAVEDIFEDLPQFLATACSDEISSDKNFNLLINTTRSDINELPYKYFVDGTKTADNLILEHEKEIAKKYSGTSMYYLSTGSTTTNYVSGILYEAKNPSANILNRYFPSRAGVPNIDNLKTLKDLGGFFTPTKLGILNYSTPTFTYKIDTANLLTDTLYVFPDPDLYASGRGNTKTDQPAALKHTDDATIIKADISNEKLQGNIVDATNVHKMWPYQSRQETLNLHATGISRSVDNIDFWIGTKKDIWSNADIYPIYEQQPLPVQNKLDDLLISNNILYKWTTDIFGNEYGLYKDTHPTRQTSAQKTGNYITPVIQSTNSTLDTGLTALHSKKLTKYYEYQQSTSFTTEYNSVVSDISTETSIYDKHDTFGHWYVRTSSSTVISPVSSALSGVFVKYKQKTELYDELKYNIKSFDVIKDILIIETANFVVIEQLKYNAANDTFASNLHQRVFISLSGSNRNFENFGNIWYNDTDNKIFLSKLLLHPHLSGSNYKIIYPNIYEYNLNNNKLTLVSPASDTYDALLSDGFSLAGTDTQIDIVSVSRPIISYDRRANTCIVTYTAMDPGNKVYTTIIYYDTAGSSTFTINKTLMFKPGYSSIVNYHAHNFSKTSTQPSISADMEGPLHRGASTEAYLISVDGYTSQILFSNDVVPLSFPLPGTSTQYQTLSGNPSPAVTKVVDQTTNTILLGHGLSAGSANSDFQDGTSILPYTHNSSYILHNTALDPAVQDIEIYADVAFYTLTSGNSAYQQTLVTGTSSFEAIHTGYDSNRLPGGGLCVFYFDADYEFYPAGIGSALGYTNYTGPMGSGHELVQPGSACSINGIRGGYVGVGFDVEGNFGNTTDGKMGLSGTGIGTANVTTCLINTVLPNTLTVRSSELSSYQVLATTTDLSNYPVTGDVTYDASPSINLHEYVSSRDDINFHKIKVALQNSGKRIKVDVLNPADQKFYPYLQYDLDRGIAVPTKLRMGLSFATSNYFTNCEIKNFGVYGTGIDYEKRALFLEPRTTTSFTVTPVAC